MFSVYKLSCGFINLSGIYNHVKRSSWELWAKGDLSHYCITTIIILTLLLKPV